MRFIEDVIEFIIQNIDYTINIDRIIFADGYSTLYIKDTAHLRTGKSVSINGNDHMISDFLINKWIKVVGEVDSSVKSFEAYQLGYQSGSLKFAEMERGKQRKLQIQSLPFVWNQEPYSINQVFDYESPVFAEPNLTWYLLDECNTKSWLVKDHHREIIEPISNLFNNRVRSFIRKRTDYFNQLADVTITPREFLGVQGVNGNESRLFSENLSGIEVNFTLPIMKNCCLCN